MCNSLAFRTSVTLRLLLDLDTYRGVDPLGVFPLFLKKVADIISPKLSIIFYELIRLGSFPECWRSLYHPTIIRLTVPIKFYYPLPGFAQQTPSIDSLTPLQIRPLTLDND